MLLGSRCPVCRSPGPAPCRGCVESLHPAPALAPPVGLDDCRSLLAYEGVGRELVARLKHRNERAALPGLAAATATLVDPTEIDVVTWAPTTPERRRARGYDQSALLARAVARALHRPQRRLLARAPGPPQTGRAAAERWSGPRFVPRPPVAGRVLLLDDVVTTGATMSAAASALRTAGATSVIALTIARTALKTTTERDDG